MVTGRMAQQSIHNLPSQLTSFIGRSDEVVGLVDLLADEQTGVVRLCRLVEGMPLALNLSISTKGDNYEH